MADETTDNPNESGDTDEQKAYKKLQTQLNKSRDSARQYQKDALKNAGLESDIADLTKTVGKLIEAIKDGSDEDDLAAIETESSAEKQRSVVRREYQEEIADLFLAEDTTWADERLEDARKKWENGDFPGALSETRRILDVSSGADAETIENIVKAKLAEYGVHVDTEGPSSGDGKRLTYGDMEDAKSLMRTDPKAALAAMKEIDDQFYKE